jgi:hypothetical protein
MAEHASITRERTIPVVCFTAAVGSTIGFVSFRVGKEVMCLFIDFLLAF